MAALNGTENEKAFISEELYEKLSAVSGKLEKGDVLVTGGGSVGKPYIVPNNEPLYTKDADLLWIKNNENLDPYFVYTFFFSPTFTDYLNSVSHVGTIAHYTITQLGETPITLPCVSEQQKIGDYFRNLDFLITLHQRECFSFDFGSRSAKVAQKTISWEQRKLGEISESFEYGLNAAATEYDGKHKYIRITDIDDSTHLFIQDNLTSPDIDFSTADDYLLQAGDVLFARTGASVGKTYIYRSSDGDLYFAGFLIRAKIKRDYDADFVFQNTLTDNYDSYIRITSQRSGQPGVNAQEYANFALSVPCLAEQKKIGAYFTNLDNLITLHQRECFSFDFSGESAKTAQKTISWEQRKLNEYLTVSTKKNTEDKYDKTDVLSVSGEVGVVNQIEFQGRSFAGASVSNYGVVETGDVVYTKSPLRANPYGIIKANKGKSGIVSTLYAVYKTIQGTANADFIECYFDLDDRLNMYLKPLVNIGAKHDMKVTDENALKGGVLFPSYEEQCQIADFFSRLDTLITLHQHKPNKKGHDVLSVMPFKGNQRKPHYLCT